MRLYDPGPEFAIGICLFRAVKLTQNADVDKYRYSGYIIRFDACSSFSLSNGSGFGKNVIIFGVENSTSVHVDKNKKDILILRKVPTDGLDDNTITAEAEYSITFTKQQNNFFLNLHCNGSNNSSYVNGVKIYQFKTKDFEIVAYPKTLQTII